MISPQQASDFAKSVAGDFNPLHDPDSRRFCVPGDLLFALVVQQFGLSQRMEFHFLGMVGAHRVLEFPEMPGEQFFLRDTDGKEYVRIYRTGSVFQDENLIDPFIQAYVAFSGQNFPHVLVPLMQEHGVMVHPERPLVIYESMSLQLRIDDLASLRVSSMEARLDRSTMQLEGKRGQIDLKYTLCCDGQPIADGSKRMMIGSMLPFDSGRILQMTERYQQLREQYLKG